MTKVPIILLVLLLLGGCKKHEVDIEAMTTNPFDVDWQGTSFLHVDSIRTYAIGQGGVFQQRIFLGLPYELRQSPDYVIRLIEQSGPDTSFFAAGDPEEVTMILLNQQVMLGTEYCFAIDLSIGGAILGNHRVTTCGIAQL